MESQRPHVLGYFDSSLIPSGGNSSPTPALGFVVTHTGGAPSPGISSTAAAATADLAMVTPEFHWTFHDRAVIPGGFAAITGSPAERGPQLWDLMAARCALESIASSGYSGPVTMLGDGLGVISYMTGNIRSMSIYVGATNIAPPIRADIMTVTTKFESVSWRWIPRSVNPADRELRPVVYRARRSRFRRASSFPEWPG